MKYFALIIIEKIDKEIADSLLLPWHEWEPKEGFTHFDDERILSTNGEHTHYFISVKISQSAKEYLEQLPTNEALTPEQAQAVSRSSITIFEEDLNAVEMVESIHAVFNENGLVHDDWEASQIE